MKKKKAKKAVGAKKKDDKPEASGAPDTPDEKGEEATAIPESSEAVVSPDHVEDDEPTELPTTTHSHGRKPSIAIESRQRSASFYRGAVGTPTSPNPITPGGGVSSDIYREQ